jgi:glycine/D-amino acid oxidase-like deaminating enzyme
VQGSRRERRLRFLSQAGVEDILLLDERPPLTLTSDRSTECYRNWWPDREVTALMNRSIDLLEGLADASANVFRLNRRGYLYVTADGGKLPLMQEQAQRISASGAGPLRVHADSSLDYVPSKPEGYRECLEGADLLLGRKFSTRLPHDRSAAPLCTYDGRLMSAQQLGISLSRRARRAPFRTARFSG